MAGGINAEINDAWKNPKERELKDSKLKQPRNNDRRRMHGKIPRNGN